MKYQRLHIRVPASGDAILLEKGAVKVEASVINVSVGGQNNERLWLPGYILI